MTDQPVAVVTGANSGIGLETVRGLAQMDMHVVMICRDPTRARRARADVEFDVPGASLSIVLCDLSLQSDVRRAAEHVRVAYERLDLLVNNAGAMLRRRAVTAEGVDVMLAVNHVGPFLLTNLLLPLLRASAPSRIVNVASAAHALARLDLVDLEATRGYGWLGFPRYFETKLMNVIWTRELARRLDGSGVTANCLHPGNVATNLGHPPVMLRPLARHLFDDAARGAKTTLAAATDPAFATVNGSYFVDLRPANHKLVDRALDEQAGVDLWAATEALVAAVGRRSVTIGDINEAN